MNIKTKPISVSQFISTANSGDIIAFHTNNKWAIGAKIINFMQGVKRPEHVGIILSIDREKCEVEIGECRFLSTKITKAKYLPSQNAIINYDSLDKRFLASNLAAGKYEIFFAPLKNDMSEDQANRLKQFWLKEIDSGKKYSLASATYSLDFISNIARLLFPSYFKKKDNYRSCARMVYASLNEIGIEDSKIEDQPSPIELLNMSFVGETIYKLEY